MIHKEDTSDNFVEPRKKRGSKSKIEPMEIAQGEKVQDKKAKNPSPSHSSKILSSLNSIRSAPSIIDTSENKISQLVDVDPMAQEI
jgi:hypothetical protein